MSLYLQDDEKKRPVLQDVADRVGVTKMTVSRFYATRAGFRRSTRQDCRRS
ncbi:hypothetical protein DMI60_05240 [Escherichia coli]|nr:hypothetical protein [Escherichia coli]